MIDLYRLHLTQKIFTFHSGYIPIDKMILNTRTNMAFTFHSGYIPMHMSLDMPFCIELLYIPFWLYSN